MSNENKNSAVAAEVSAIVAETKATLKSLDSYFTIEHQGMIAAKYRVKYSDADQQEHKAIWPEFVGNHFTMYVLAETLSEARKAVFSANKKIFLNNLIGAMVNYTPLVHGQAVTELQVMFNKTTDMQLQGLYDLVTDESQRVELLKDYAKMLKLVSKTGKDTDTNKAKFFHASATLGVTPNTIW
jgi:hypothetical protein